MSHFTALGKLEAEAAYHDLVKGKRPIQIQISGEKLRKAKAVSREAGEILFKIPYIERFQGSFKAVITFSLPPEVFFLKTQVVGDNGKYYFKETKDIFRLQRRDTFRLMVPDIIEAEIHFLRGETFRLHDISQGGFSIELPAKKSDSFATGSRLTANITLLGEVFSNLLCEAKHARLQTLDKTKVLVGFQLLKLKPKQEEMLFRLITDIARTHFR